MLGYFQKRDCPGNVFWCEGNARVLRIENGETIYLFTPEDKRLYPVEATLVVR